MSILLDLRGERFARLVVLKRAVPVGRRATWECECDCGATVYADTANLRRGTTKSCGCLSRDNTTARSLTHGHTAGHSRGRPVSPEYEAWHSIKRRTSNPRCVEYPRYGARGITMASEWLNDFERFYADMGPRPEGMSIDRIDNDRGYGPGNCRWATRSQQANNRRGNVRVVYDGKEMTLKEVALIAGVSYQRLWQRYRLNRQSIDAAVAHCRKKSQRDYT